MKTFEELDTLYNRANVRCYVKNRTKYLEQAKAKREQTKLDLQRPELDQKRLNALRNKWSTAKARAWERHKNWRIEFDDYIQLSQLPCYYCKGSLPLMGGGLDRIDSNKGYEPNNVVPCCAICNRVKGDNHTVAETMVMIQARENMRQKNNVKKENPNVFIA